jgi:protein TonB
VYTTHTNPGTRGGVALAVIAGHAAVIYAVAVTLGVVEAPAFAPKMEVVMVAAPEPVVEEPEPVRTPPVTEPDIFVPEPIAQIEVPVETPPVIVAPVAPPAANTAITSSGSGPMLTTTLKVTRRVEPMYPPASRRLAEEGTVQLRVHVDERGRARDVELLQSSGFDRLDAAAIAAVRRWQFSPAMQHSRAVPAWTQVNVLFRLDQ